jgi:hypothetical protein
MNRPILPCEFIAGFTATCFTLAAACLLTFAQGVGQIRVGDPAPSSVRTYLTISADFCKLIPDTTRDSRVVPGECGCITLCVRRDDQSPVERDHLGCEERWPDSLAFSVTSSDGTERRDWLSQMNIQQGCSLFDQPMDSLRSPDPLFSRLSPQRETYEFRFTVPASAAGQTLLVSATMDHGFDGILHSANAALDVSGQRLKSDRNIVWDSELYVSWYFGELDRAITLADSFLGRDYSGFTGLTSAQRAACLCGRYDKALKYLDLCMAANGRIAFFEKSNDLPTVNPPAGASESKPTRRVAEQEIQRHYSYLRGLYVREMTEHQLH